MSTLGVSQVRMALVSLALIGSIVTTGSKQVVQASGPWAFCSSLQSTNCIESVVVEAPGLAAVTHHSSDSLSTAGVLVDVGCLSGSCTTSTSTAKIIEANRNNCAAISETPRPIYVTAQVPGHADHVVTLNLNTGTFEPAISVGTGIESTSSTRGDDGIWRLSLRMKSEVRAMTSLPSSIWSLTGPEYDSAVKEFMKTAVADKTVVNSAVSIFPPLVLRWMESGTLSTSGRVAQCELIPMNGAWMTANANGFEFGARTKSVKSDIPWEFKFNASAPHMIKSGMLESQPTSGFGIYNHGPFSGTDLVNPAEMRMWVPDSYVRALGYASGSEMLSAMTVTAEDGQPTSPSVVASSGGHQIDLGIAHYSSPNPTVSFSPGKLFVRATDHPKMRVGKPTSQASLLKVAGLKVDKKSKVMISVKASSSRICRKSGTAVKALKVGTCSVQVTVKSRSGASKSKTLKFTVVK